MDDVERARAAYAARAWADAYECYQRAARESPLGADDLERLAVAAFLIGRDDDTEAGLTAAYRSHLDGGDALRAVRCLYWLAITLISRGEPGRGSGWFARAGRLLEGLPDPDCAEAGYLLFPAIFEQADSGDHEAAYATATRAAEIGVRFGDPDLTALAVHHQGRALLSQGQVRAGLRLLDEAMVAVTADELSPIVTGLLYCSVLEGCHEVYDVGRGHEWTAALSRWCGDQPDLVTFGGECMVHRAELMQLHGAWPEALEEARLAMLRFERRPRNPSGAAPAYYRQGELHRLRGEYALAEEAYLHAGRLGWEPQPGLALLRLGRGDPQAAVAAIRRVLDGTGDALRRSRLLAAYAEILTATGDRDQAGEASRELSRIAQAFPSRMLTALAGHAAGAVELAGGDARAAAVELRRTVQAWRELDAPYEAARTQELLGLACRELGDEDTAAIELAAARETYARLGAAPDLARVAGAPVAAGLSPRELEVLRRLAAGDSNKAIAGRLLLSERTVDRHVSNIYAKLGVSSRAAATAHAYEQGLI